jgi:hypothetical protein
MPFSRPVQWYQSHEDPIWPNGTFNKEDQTCGFFGGFASHHLFIKNILCANILAQLNREEHICLMLPVVKVIR